MTSRGLLAILAALLIATQAVRNFWVAAHQELRPELAAMLWPGHPDVELSGALVEIARASRARQPVPPSTFALVDDAAQKSPLSPQPFLVHGVEASVAGEPGAAARDFLQAQRRDPRSLPAAYFLTDYYFRAGRPLDGLRQAATLARLSPAGAAPISRLVASYAQDSRNWADIRALFRSDETIEDQVLAALAADAGNAPAILAIADGAHRRASSPWLPRLLRSLVAAGQYQRARAIWAAVSGVRLPAGTLLYDAGFAAAEPPEPFNWKLASSNLGIAERERGGTLHVIYYGGVDGVLASQLLLLEPGTYRLRLRIAPDSDHPESLRWSIRCDKASKILSAAPLDAAARQGWLFAVRQDCPAQWLELSGRAADLPQQAEVRLTGLALERVNAGG